VDLDQRDSWPDDRPPYPVYIAGVLAGDSTLSATDRPRGTPSFIDRAYRGSVRGAVTLLRRTQVQTSADVASVINLDLPARRRAWLLSVDQQNPDSVARSMFVLLQRDDGAPGSPGDPVTCAVLNPSTSVSASARYEWPNGSTSVQGTTPQGPLGPLYGGDGTMWRIVGQCSAGTGGGASLTHVLQVLALLEPEEDEGDGTTDRIASTETATS